MWATNKSERRKAIRCSRSAALAQPQVSAGLFELLSFLRPLEPQDLHKLLVPSKSQAHKTEIQGGYDPPEQYHPIPSFKLPIVTFAE